MTAQVVATFSVTNVNVSMVLTDILFFDQLAQFIWPLFESYVDTDAISLHTPNVTSDILLNITANIMTMRFTLSPVSRGANTMHIAELHNAIRVLGMTNKKHNPIWDGKLKEHSPDFLTSVTDWWRINGTNYTVGTPTVTADEITLAALAGAFDGGIPPQRTIQTTVKPGSTTAADSAYGTRPFFLLLGWIFAQTM